MSAASPAMAAWQRAFDSRPNRDTSRHQAFADFIAQGLPTAKHDAWKYTDLRRLALRQFHLPTDVVPAPDVDLGPSFTPGSRIVFIDGRPMTGRSMPAAAGISIESTTSLPTLGTEPFDLLNAALSTETIQIRIVAPLDAPVQLTFLWTERAADLMVHPRIRLLLESGARAILLENHVGVSPKANFTNSVVDLTLAEDARLEHVRIQDDIGTHFHVAAIRATLAREATYINRHFVLGAALSRTDINVRLQGARARAELDGLIYARGAEHLDVRTCVEHRVADTYSREDYRGIADQRGRVVFNGKVVVATDAQRTDASQSSRNLLLSEQAEIDTRPEFEIYANDVKCAHGATVGQLDPDALFYLRARGIDAPQARALLTHAFATEIIDRLPIPELRAHLLTRFLERMRAGGSE